MSINWKQKLTSRKLWAALIAIITTVVVAIFKEDIPADVVGLIGKGVIALCCYIFGESFVDVAREIWNKATTLSTTETVTEPQPATVSGTAAETVTAGEVNTAAVGIHEKVPAEEESADKNKSTVTEPEAAECEDSADTDGSKE